MKTSKFESFPQPEQSKQPEKPKQPEKSELEQPQKQKKLPVPFSPEIEAELKSSQILESEKNYRQKLKEKIEDAKKKSQGYLGSFLKQQLDSAERRESDIKNLLRNLMDYPENPKQRNEVDALIKSIKAGYQNELLRLNVKAENLRHDVDEIKRELNKLETQKENPRYHVIKKKLDEAKEISQQSLENIKKDATSIKNSLAKFKTEVLDEMANLNVISRKKTKIGRVVGGKKIK